MKRFNLLLITLAAGAALFSSCGGKSDDDRAGEMIKGIEASVEKGDFRSALDSIIILRDRYPKALNARKRALELWQQASLIQAENDARVTDSLLQETLGEIDKAPTLLEQNRLRNRRDSLSARYDAQTGLIKIIKAKQNGK